MGSAPDVDDVSPACRVVRLAKNALVADGNQIELSVVIVVSALSVSTLSIAELARNPNVPIYSLADALTTTTVFVPTNKLNISNDRTDTFLF